MPNFSNSIYHTSHRSDNFRWNQLLDHSVSKIIEILTLPTSLRHLFSPSEFKNHSFLFLYSTYHTTRFNKNWVKITLYRRRKQKSNHSPEEFTKNEDTEEEFYTHLFSNNPIGLGISLILFLIILYRLTCWVMVKSIENPFRLENSGNTVAPTSPFL